MDDYLAKTFKLIPACWEIAQARKTELQAVREQVAARKETIRLLEATNENQQQALRLCEETDRALSEALSIARRKQRSARIWKTATAVSLVAFVTTLLVK